jgi:hypothetical protein
MKVRRAVDMPLSVGTLLAREGAWNRKYQVVAVKQLDENNAEVEIVNVGSRFSDGRVVPARCAIRRPLKMRKILGTWASSWGGFMAYETSFRNRYIQVQVRPQP